MTVKEVAEIFGVTAEAVKKWVRELYPEIIQNGVAIELNEAHVTAIKMHMRPTTKVLGAQTDMEMSLRLMECATYFREKYEESLHAIEEMKPAHDFGKYLIDSRVGFVGWAEAAAILEPQIKMGRNSLLAWLRGHKILMGDNVPYREYIERGYFRVTEKETPVGPKVVALVSNKGIEYILRFYNQLAHIENAE